MDNYKKVGYDVIRIPYFVQLDFNILSFFFQEYVDVEIVVEVEEKLYNGYPHGFISDYCILPSDFNTVGLMKFESFITTLEDIDDIDIFQISIEIKRNLLWRGLVEEYSETPISDFFMVIPFTNNNHHLNQITFAKYYLDDNITINEITTIDEDMMDHVLLQVGEDILP